jgi:hypothetical protein
MGDHRLVEERGADLRGGVLTKRPRHVAEQIDEFSRQRPISWPLMGHEGYHLVTKEIVGKIISLSA